MKSYTFLEDKILDETSAEVMMSWETPMMKKHAEVVTENGGDILEIGFGMGICSDFIQQHTINSHTIIEIHDQVFEKLLEWAKDKPNVIPVKGDWLNSIPPKKYDGIMFDTWKDNRNIKFKKIIRKYVKEGTIFTFYNSYQSECNGYNYDAEYTVLDVEPDKQDKKYFTHKKYYLPKVIF
jgi:spermidine synthase|tara:strand:- start:970 stop:1509 length:540 start_codon:yes stop_codon:yes gene_type:complete